MNYPVSENMDFCPQTQLQTNGALLHSVQIAFSLTILMKNHHNFKSKGKEDC